MRLLCFVSFHEHQPQTSALSTCHSLILWRIDSTPLDNIRASSPALRRSNKRTTRPWHWSIKTQEHRQSWTRNCGKTRLCVCVLALVAPALVHLQLRSCYSGSSALSRECSGPKLKPFCVPKPNLRLQLDFSVDWVPDLCTPSRAFGVLSHFECALLSIYIFHLHRRASLTSSPSWCRAPSEIVSSPEFLVSRTQVVSTSMFLVLRVTI